MSKDLQRFNTKDSKSHNSNAAEQLLPEQVDFIRLFMISQNDIVMLQHVILQHNYVILRDHDADANEPEQANA